MPDSVPVIVVGGGIAGMVAARDLSIGGRRVVLLEASPTLGGKVARHVVGGIQLDAGAESFATRGGTVAALAAEVGLGGDIVTPNPAGAWLQPIAGRALPLPRAGLLGIPTTPLARDVIAVVGLSGALRAQLDSLLTGLVGSRSHSLGALVRRRMGRRVLQRLVAPVVVGVHSRHPDDLAVDTVVPGLRAAMLRNGSLAGAVRGLRASAPAGSAVAGIREGIFRLVDALQTDLLMRGVEIRTDTRVVSAGSGQVDLASGESLTGRVVMATALGPAVRVPVRGAVLGASIELVTLVVDLPQLDATPRGTGLLVAAGNPDIRAKALTHATAKWPWLAEQLGPHRHVLRLSYDGDVNDLADPPSMALADVARDDAERLLGVPVPESSLISVAHVSWMGQVPTEASAPDGMILVGERVAGTGLAGVIAQARQQAESLLNGLGE